MTRPAARDTLQRQWQLLRAIPRYPSKITASALRDRLEAVGARATVRTVERDLVALLPIFPLVVDDRSKPYGWSWLKNAPALDIPGLSGPQALTFTLVDQYLRPLLPASVLDQIAPYVKAARKTLDGLPKNRGIPAWPDKIRVIHPTQMLLPPLVPAGVSEVVHTALLEGRPIEITYRKSGAAQAIPHTAHPLGLVQRGPVMYLVCTLYGYTDVRLLALHRIKAAHLGEGTVRYPTGFSLDAYIESGALDFGEGKLIRLEAIFARAAAEHLQETRLSADQTMREVDADHVRITATVRDTWQFTWWLLSFGAQVEVIKPRSVRKQLAETAAAMYELYGGGSGRAEV